MFQYWGEKKMLFFPLLSVSMSDGIIEVTSLFCVYNTHHPLSMYCVLAPFCIKQCHCCNSNLFSTKVLPPIVEAVKVECSSP